MTEHVETQTWRMAEFMEHASHKTGRLPYSSFWMFVMLNDKRRKLDAFAAWTVSIITYCRTRVVEVSRRGNYRRDWLLVVSQGCQSKNTDHLTN